MDSTKKLTDELTKAEITLAKALVFTEALRRAELQFTLAQMAGEDLDLIQLFRGLDWMRKRRDELVQDFPQVLDEKAIAYCIRAAGLWEQYVEISI